MKLRAPRSLSHRAWAVVAALVAGWAVFPELSAKSGAGTKEAVASVWKVSSASSTVYLAGSVHLLRSEDYPLPPVYDAAYAAAEVLRFEVDLGASMDLGAAGRIAAMGKLPQGETIKDHVSEETYDLLKSYLKSRGIGGAIFESMKPGLLAVMIASFEYMRLGASPQLGVDMHYFNKAKEDGKGVAGFETAEFQLGLFNNLSAEKQELMLRDTLENLDEAEESSGELIKAWREGNVKALRKLLADQLTKDKELAKVLLYKRNRSWIPPIVELLKGDKDAMVIVGAGHLVGRGSVVRLLEKRGYEVEQVRFKIPKPAKPRGKEGKAPAGKEKPAAEEPAAEPAAEAVEEAPIL